MGDMVKYVVSVEKRYREAALRMASEIKAIDSRSFLKRLFDPQTTSKQWRRESIDRSNDEADRWLSLFPLMMELERHGYSNLSKEKGKYILSLSGYELTPTLMVSVKHNEEIPLLIGRARCPFCFREGRVMRCDSVRFVPNQSTIVTLSNVANIEEIEDNLIREYQKAMDALHNTLR